jgi:hypothetical protein
MIADGSGGALVMWEDHPDNSDIGLFAQRVTPAGASLWTPGGVRFAIGPSFRTFPVAVLDQVGGFIVGWCDERTGSSVSGGGSDLDIYAQRLNGAGAPQWIANGVPVCVAPADQIIPSIRPDGAGGAVLVWVDERRGGSGVDIYGQHLNASGGPMLQVNGVSIGDTTSYDFDVATTSDSGGGVIAVWDDGRNGHFNWRYGGTNFDIYVGRLSSPGTLDVPVPRAPAVQLLAPWPNPVRTAATIAFALSTAERATIEVLDVAGHRIRTLATSYQYSPGRHTLAWNGLNDAGAPVPTGLYFVRMRAGGISSMQKIVFLHRM